MIQYTVMNSPVGKLLLAQSKKGLNHIIFEYQIHQFESIVHKKYPNQPIERNNAALQPVVDQLKAYFSGERNTFNLNLDADFANIDPKYLSETLKKLDTNGADALFISCTALPALGIIEEVEKKIDKLVFSSNQTLIWDTIRSTGYKSSIKGYGKLLRN